MQESLVFWLTEEQGRGAGVDEISVCMRMLWFFVDMAGLFLFVSQELTFH